MVVSVGASSFSDTSRQAMELLEKYGIEVRKNPFGRKLTEEETIAHLQGADGLLAGLEPLDERVFSACPQLKAIARIGIGMDNVDAEAAKRHGIKVSNTPDAPTEAVAEMTLAALLTIAHQIVPANADVHGGVWKKRMGFSIRGTKVLVVGYGRIGRRTAELMQSLGAEIAVYDKYAAALSTCSLEEGLGWADVITLHAAGADMVLSESKLRLCRQGAILLNSARGGLVDEDALCRMLQSGWIASYWGDALWSEPYTGKLCACPNAILTPHICTYTTRCREDMETAAAHNLLGDLGCVSEGA